jgi:hypothetical protein
MADRKSTAPIEGETRFGAERAGQHGTLYIPSGNVASLGSVLALDGTDSAGATTTWYLFVTSAGTLKIASTYPTDTELGGSAV